MPSSQFGSPTLAFVVFGAISAIVSFFLVETMSAIPGNDEFQDKLQYSTLAHKYAGRKTHILMQVLLYCALQSVNTSSIIISAQTADSIIIRLFKKTCAVSFTEGWTCVSTTEASGSPFDTYILFSLGYIAPACLVLPLSIMSLVQNIKFQLLSVVGLFFTMGSWIFIFASDGLDHKVVPVGTSQSTLIGFVLNNFAFIITIPSLINELSRDVSIHKTISYPIVLCILMYLTIGLSGASYLLPDSPSDILAALVMSSKHKTFIVVINIIFPVAVLITSVPVFAIVMRYNLVRSGFCSNKWGMVWASFMPWILIIPFQTKGWLLLVMNWTSLVFGSSTNFMIPLILYLLSKRHHQKRELGDAGSTCQTIVEHDPLQEAPPLPLQQNLPQVNVRIEVPDNEPADLAHEEYEEQQGQMYDQWTLSTIDEGSEDDQDASPRPPSHDIDRVGSINYTPCALSADSRQMTGETPVARDDGIVNEEAGVYPEQKTVFSAFPERKWWRSIVVARFALGFISLTVTANLVLAIVSTAKGKNPLGNWE